MGEDQMPVAIAAESFEAHERLVSSLGPKLACALEANLVLAAG